MAKKKSNKKQKNEYKYNNIRFKNLFDKSKGIGQAERIILDAEINRYLSIENFIFTTYVIYLKPARNIIYESTSPIPLEKISRFKRYINNNKIHDLNGERLTRFIKDINDLLSGNHKSSINSLTNSKEKVSTTEYISAFKKFKYKSFKEKKTYEIFNNTKVDIYLMSFQIEQNAYIVWEPFETKRATYIFKCANSRRSHYELLITNYFQSKKLNKRSNIYGLLIKPNSGLKMKKLKHENVATWLTLSKQFIRNNE